MDFELLSSDLEWLHKRMVYLTRRGLHAYGLDLPDSDQEYRGLAIPPLRYHFGCLERFQQAGFEEPEDVVVYDFQYAVQLATDANPNTLELLFADPEDQLYCHPLAQRLLDSRDSFLTQRVAHTFQQAARSHLKQVTRMGYGRGQYTAEPGMHAVRLLRMAREVMSGQGLLVRRPDADELREIRAGAWTYDQLDAEVRGLEAQVRGLKGKSPLPQEPDLETLDRLCCDLVAASFDHEVQLPVMGKWESVSWSFGHGQLSAKDLSPRTSA